MWSDLYSALVLIVHLSKYVMVLKAAHFVIVSLLLT